MVKEKTGIASPEKLARVTMPLFAGNQVLPPSVLLWTPAHASVTNNTSGLSGRIRTSYPKPPSGPPVRSQVYPLGGVGVDAGAGPLTLTSSISTLELSKVSSAIEPLKIG